jgi:predicted transposase/invertase (TIGR01784 family)
MDEKKSKTAARKVSRTEKPKKRPKVKDLGVYVNLLTDFGFKRIFGIKEVMLHFLNTVLASDIKGAIIDLHYENVERLGSIESDRKAIYDLICTTGTGEHIIVEMQAVWQEHFKDRILSYVAQLIQDQNVKGEDWDFELPPIYSINLLNFTFDRADTLTEKYASYVQLIDRDTHHVFYNKLTFVYVELPRFTKELSELKTFFEQWMFIIRFLHGLEEIPESFRNEIFETIFEEAKIARMTKEEKKKYFKSLKNLKNMDIVKIELNKAYKKLEARDNVIAAMSKDLASRDNVIASRDNVIAAKDSIIAEYRRRFGALNDHN